MIDKKNMLDRFSKINIKDLDFILCSKRNFYWQYLLDNSVVTLSDLYNLYKKEYDSKKLNSYSAINIGILNLCLFKYFGICRKGYIDLLDSELGVEGVVLNEENKQIISKFTLLGLDLGVIRSIYYFRENGKKMIDYFRYFITLEGWSKEKINLFSLLIQYYDTYYKNLNNPKSKKI